MSLSYQPLLGIEFDSTSSNYPTSLTILTDVIRFSNSNAFH